MLELSEDCLELPLEDGSGVTDLKGELYYVQSVVVLFQGMVFCELLYWPVV